MELEIGFVILKTIEQNADTMAEIAALIGAMTTVSRMNPQASGIGICDAAEPLQTTQKCGVIL